MKSELEFPFITNGNLIRWYNDAGVEVASGGLVAAVVPSEASSWGSLPEIHLESMLSHGHGL